MLSENDEVLYLDDVGGVVEVFFFDEGENI